MKKYLKTILLVCAFSFLFLFNASFAQTNANQDNSKNQFTQSSVTMLADVNIYSATSTKTGADTYAVSFEIFNRTGIQSGIRYGLQLISREDGSVVDTMLSNESLTLKEGESKNIQMSYSIPGFIKDGKYTLFVVAQNENSLPLAKVPAGYPPKIITITRGTAGPVIENCDLTVPSDATSTKYNNLQGVDILPTEKLVATCKIQNTGGNSINNFKLQLITHKRDKFGDILANNVLEQNISIKAKSSQEISFEIPTIKDPQAYDIDTFIVNDSNEKVSPSYYLHYVIHGSSATIQNVLLDKVSYEKGDNAEIKVFWTAAADSFVGSRLGGTNIKYFLNAKITDSAGVLCGEISNQASKPDNTGFGKDALSIKTSEACKNAIATITITDEKGNILATNKIDTNSGVEEVNITSGVKNASALSLGGFNRNYIIIFLVLLVLIAYGILVLRKDKKPNTDSEIRTR